MDTKQFIKVLSYKKAAVADDLHRARLAFRGQDLSAKYGESEQTKGEILRGYDEALVDYDAAIAWVSQK